VAFPLTAQGVFVVGSGTAERGIAIEGLWIRFPQPDTTIRASITQFPPAIFSNTGARLRIRQMLITQAWTGIYLDACGGARLTEIDCSAYAYGLRLSPTIEALDAVCVSGYEFWPFDTTTNQQQIMWDGTTVGLDIGRVDGLLMSDSSLYRCLVNVYPTVSTPGFYEFSNIAFDSAHTTLTVINALRCLLTNCYWSKSTLSETAAVAVSNGRVSFVNCNIESSMAATTAVQVTGGVVKFTGGAPFWKENAAASMFNVSGGTLILDNLYLGSHVTTHTTPFVHQSGAGILQMSGCFCLPGITAVVAQIDTANAGNFIAADNNFAGMTLTGVGAVSPLQAYGYSVATSAQWAIVPVGGFNSQESKQRFFGTFPSGADTVPHLTASLRSGFNALNWNAGYLNVSITNTTNGTSTDANMSTVGSFTLTGLNACAIGATTPATGAFTGINFGSAVAPGGVTDLSRHIALYSTTYGFNVTGSRLNYIVGSGSSHVLTVNGLDYATVSSAGFAVGNTTLAANLNLDLNTVATNARSLRFLSAGSQRVNMVLTGGENFALQTYDNTGTLLGNALVVTRLTGLVQCAFGLQVTGNSGFNGTAPIAKPSISGSRGGNAALASLLTALASYGLVTDGSTA